MHHAGGKEHDGRRRRERVRHLPIEIYRTLEPGEYRLLLWRGAVRGGPPLTRTRPAHHRPLPRSICAVGIANTVRPEPMRTPMAQILTFGPKSGEQIAADFCAAGRQPHGGWVEYNFTKPGETQATRKVSYLPPAMEPARAWLAPASGRAVRTLTVMIWSKFSCVLHREPEAAAVEAILALPRMPREREHRASP